MPAETDVASCDEAGCTDAAAFRFYERPAGVWRPLCQRHARTLHPSLELGALLESGYLRPVELAPPDGPPSAPGTARAAAFREEVEALLGWRS